MKITERFKKAISAFKSNEENLKRNDDIGYGSYYPEYLATRYSKGSITDTIFCKIANDVANIEFKHVLIDDDPKTEEIVDDSLHECLTLEANIDQSAIDFKKDIVFSMMDEGVIAVVPTWTDVDNTDTYSYEILAMRVGKIVQWYPYSVRVNLYDEETCRFKDIIVEKTKCAIIENPLYEIVNGENSTAKRLIRKLQLLDTVDERTASNKLDMIIQMPYATKNEMKREQARERINDIQDQLQNSKYGIAYIDSTEKVTQISKSLENNLLKEVELLTEELYNKLGLSKTVFNGTASEQELLNYYNSTINPIAKKIAMEFNRKFLTKTARTQGHKIIYYHDPFDLVPLSQAATIADTLRRNEIFDSNEVREIFGRQPRLEERANQLENPNISDTHQNGMMDNEEQQGEPILDDSQKDAVFDVIEKSII